MIEKMKRDVAGAHSLQQSIVDSVFDYVNEDVTRSTFGVNAAVQASIELVRCSSMSDQAKVALAQSVFQSLTEDIDLSVSG